LFNSYKVTGKQSCNKINRNFTCRPDPEGTAEAEGVFKEEEEAQENESTQCNPKRRNLITQTEEDRIILEDGQDSANEPEEEEPEEDVIYLGSDNGDQSDSFESHFASPSPSRFASISSASQGEWKDTKLPKSRLLGNAYLSIPGGLEQTTGRRRIEGQIDLNLKKKLVAQELTPLQKSLGQLVFNYVNVLYSEQTLGNAKELRRMYSLHALNHVLKYVSTQVLDHFHTNKNSAPEAES